jgi:hypothetical protein
MSERAELAPARNTSANAGSSALQRAAALHDVRLREARLDQLQNARVMGETEIAKRWEDALRIPRLARRQSGIPLAQRMPLTR